MDKELEAKIDDLGQHYGGRLVRVAYYLSMDYNQMEASQKANRHKEWFTKDVEPDLKLQTIELGRLLAVNRTKTAVDQAQALIQMSAVEAAEKMIDTMRHPNPKYSLPASREMLALAGVKKVEEQDQHVSLELDEKALSAIQKIYGVKIDTDGDSEPEESGTSGEG